MTPPAGVRSKDASRRRGGSDDYSVAEARRWAEAAQVALELLRVDPGALPGIMRLLVDLEGPSGPSRLLVAMSRLREAQR